MGIVIITLGELKEALCRYDNSENINVELTGEWGSYRGYYDQVYIGYIKQGENLSAVSDLIGVIYDALEQGVMYGYKGGAFNVDESTEFCFALDERTTGGLYVENISADFNGVQLSVEDEE